MKPKTLHMIGNAHIDPVWLWQWQEGFHEVKATFRSALDRMKEFPDFIFVASSAAFYEWIETCDPAMFAEIQQRVQEGRWDVVGGWWMEPDCNIPAGESLVRHGLYAQRYFKSKFGKTAVTGFNIDSFGHAGTLPKILRQSGIENYVFLRPQPHEKALPSRLFWWQAEDGSKVLTFRIPFEYLSSGKDLEPHVRRCADEMKGMDESLCFYGVGNHGGGPTIANIESIHRLNEDATLPAELVLSTPERFFRTARTKPWAIPTVQSELQHHASGCYAAHSGVKRWNRQAENRLLAAEKLAAAAATWDGHTSESAFFPLDQLTHAWKAVLFNQFHDIMAGTSLEAAYEDARDSYGEAMAIAGRAINLATVSLAWRIGCLPEQDCRPLVVFNPLTWQVSKTIEMESASWAAGTVLVDETGAEVPHQRVRSTTTAGRQRLCFTADLPALGYRTFRMIPGPENALAGEPPEPMPASNTVLENEHLRLELDPLTGCISSLRDKREGLEVFSGPGARAVVLEDEADTWGHNVLQWEKVIGEFQAESVRLFEDGPVKSVIRVISRYGASKMIQDFALDARGDQIDVSVKVDWHEACKMLKLRFPVAVTSMKATHEIPYGHVERAANGDEEPMQAWVDVSGISGGSGTAYGLSLLNDGKYSVDVTQADIGLTVLRSPAYAHHLPAELDGDELFLDQGMQSFHYSLLPHRGSWGTAGTVRKAAELNQPPVALFTTFHTEGRLPQCDSYIQVTPEAVMVTVLKQSEEGNGLVVRAVETGGAAAHGRIELPKLGRTIEADFRPGEIKTFFVPKDAAAEVREVNLLEWPEE